MFWFDNIVIAAEEQWQEASWLSCDYPETINNRGPFQFWQTEGNLYFQWKSYFRLCYAIRLWQILIVANKAAWLTCDCPETINNKGQLRFRQTSKAKNNIEKFVNHHYIKKCLFSSSLLRRQNVEIEKDHYYKNQNVEKNEKNIKSLSFVKFSNFDKVILPLA